MLNIVYSGNRRVFREMLLSIMSMTKKCKEPLHIRVLSMDVTDLKPQYISISDEQVAFLDKYIKNVNPESKAELINVRKYYEEYMMGGKNQNTEYTPYTCNRLYLDLILDESVDKILYIDTDTMIYNNIEELYNIDIEGYEFAAALDYMGRFWIARDYFNGGVMLFNLKECRKTQLLSKARHLIKTKWLKLCDQSAVYRNKQRVLYLPFKFNEQRAVKPDTVIKHFCKGIKYFPFFHIYNIKQWDIENVHKKLKIFEFDDIYEEYKQLLKQYKDIII